MVRAKPDARARAVELRQEGWSYRDIQRELGVSMSSLSLWVRDVPLTDGQRAELESRRRRGAAVAALLNRQRRVEHQQRIERVAAASIGRVSERELFLVGVTLYWAEGTKAKPWSVSRGVTFVNSDASVIRLFLAWLRLLDVTEDRITVRVAIHERADISAATAFWMRATGIGVDRFLRPTLKRHNPRTVRQNTGDTYVGCLVVRVRRSTDLNRRIAGWWNGLVADIVERHR